MVDEFSVSLSLKTYLPYFLHLRKKKISNEAKNPSEIEFQMTGSFLKHVTTLLLKENYEAERA